MNDKRRDHLIFCEYELPHKPFDFCKRHATYRIEQNGYFCSQHAKAVIASLNRDGKQRRLERIA